MLNAQKLRESFNRLARQLQEDAQADNQPTPGPVQGSLLIRGNVTLMGPLADEYFDTLTKLQPKPGEDAPYSRETIDNALFTAITQMLASKDAPDVARRRAADKFVSVLQGAPAKYQFECAVFGLGSTCVGKQFGRVSFHLGAYTPRVKQMNLDAGVPYEVVTAKLEVDALDRESAILRAERSLDVHLSVLNAACSQPYPSLINVSRHYGEILQSKIYRINESSKKVRAFGGSSTLLRVNLDGETLSKFLDSQAGKNAGLLIARNDEFAARVVGALSTAGAACSARSDHEALLLFTISLESALLGRETKSELTFQLAARTAHLISPTLSKRRKAAQAVRKLYDLRSRIVHRGDTGIAPSDVREIRYVTLSALFELLSRPEFAGFTKSQDLDTWFDDRLLGSNEE